jgi:hypothetical protein
MSKQHRALVSVYIYDPMFLEFFLVPRSSYC